MRHFALFFLLVAMLLPSARAAELSPDVLKRAKMRIETLLGNRRGASPTPVNPANPFLLPEVATPTPEAPAPTGDIPLTHSDNLARLASTLNVSGYLQVQGVPHLIINGHNYQENDLIPVREAGGSVSFLHLKKITESDYTLDLNEAELVLKHTVK